MKHKVSKQILSTLLALVMVIGLIPASVLTVHAAHTCPECQEWIDGSPYCSECYACDECVEMCYQCGKCTGCTGSDICDGCTSEEGSNMCIDCAEEKGAHCPNCGTCYYVAESWCAECGFCEDCNFTWEVSGQPTAAELQMKSGSEWAKVDDLNINQTNGTISAQTGTKTYRILVTYGNSGSIYCNEFTVTWFAANANSFSMSPASGTVKNGSDYAFAWACVQTPATATLERKNGNSWDDLGTATSRKITYDNNYADTIQTFRIKATMAGGSAFYSDEFTVTYKATPLFSVQPGNGKVAVGSTYTVNYTVQTSAGDGEFDGNNSVLQKKNGGNWDNVSTSVFATQAVVPAQNSAKTETYRVGIKIGSNELLYGEEFSVQWIDDYTFELDQNSLAWGSIAKSDGYNEYAKTIKIMHTGTKTGTLKYDTPTNFYVQYWHGTYYDTLTFTPKTDITAGTHNESVNVWVSSNGSDVLEQKTVSLSITIEAPTYTVSFDKNGGSGSMASVYNVSGSYELPTCAFTAPANKEFKAWQVNGGAERNPGESITVTGNIVLTALWKDLPVVSGYTITFAAGEGTGTMNSVAGASGTYHLPACTFTAPSGKQFKAWQVNGQGEYQPGAVITVTADTTVTAIWRDIPTEYWTVRVNGLYICGAAYNYSTEQKVEKGQPMSNIIVTANDGYYFADPLQVSGAENGITVTRVNYTQVTVSGTPTADVYNIGFSASPKQKEATPNTVAFEATDSDKGNLTGLENGVSYSVTGAANAEFTATGNTYALTNVVPGTLNIVKKATDTNTKLDSDAHTYPVSKNNSVPHLYSTNCTDANNNDGKIWSVSVEMEYQKEGDNNWTTGTGANVTGLTPGTYYVRYKASSINLAGNPQTINIAAYNAPTYTVSFAANGGTGSMADATGVSGDYVLPVCGFTAPNGKQFKAWSVGGVEKAVGDKITVTANTTVTAIWEAIEYNVSGTVTSFGEATDTVTLQLIPEGLSEPAYETIVTGNTVDYYFADVAAGTYTLKVMKENHVTREYTVVVGNSSVIQDVKIQLKGDVNGDGTINAKDKKIIYGHINDSSTELTGYIFDVGDVNKDGAINAKDKKLIFGHISGTSLWS